MIKLLVKMFVFALFCTMPAGIFGAELSAEKASVTLTPDGGAWTMQWKAQGITASGMTAAVRVDGKNFTLANGKQTKREGVQTPLGAVTETIREFNDAAMPVSVRLRIWQPLNDPALAVVQGEVTNTQGKAVVLDTVDLISDAEIDLGGDGAGMRALVGLKYPQVIPLLAVPDTTFKVAGASANEAATSGAGNLAKLPQLTATEAKAKGIELKPKPIGLAGDGMVTVAAPGGGALTMSFITGRYHVPQIVVAYNEKTNRLKMAVRANFYGVTVEPGQKAPTDLAAIFAASAPLDALETMAELMAKCGPTPRKLTPPIGWNSWYAIRMGLTEELTMANAGVIAKRFLPLGMDLVLLAHGWQVDDICGDWDVDRAAFPSGFKKVSENLAKMGLKTGVWVAMSEVSGNSRLFKEHPEWMLRDQNGKPAPTWRWFWKPNPLEYALDATQAGAYDDVVKKLRRFVNDGAVYLENDFFGSCGSTAMAPASPNLARGWMPQVRMMAALREGIGLGSYLRPCGAHPLIAQGMVDGVYQTNDYLDAGPTTWPVLAAQFKTSAGQFWVDRLYNHTSCDLSIRAQGGTEECQVRTMMQFFSGSSIMFSDDLTKLPEERLVMMEKCMPGLTVAARPVNLFTSPNPDIWHLHQQVSGVDNDLIMLFNFETRDREMSVS